MSILGKKWRVKNTNKNQTILEKLLENRNLRDHRSIKTFLNPSINDLYNPFLINDMRKAIERIRKAIKDQERIIVYGDYDVDGITGAAIIIKVLQKLGANASYRLPHRVEDGYGLNEKFVHEFKKLDVKLVITIDCGISCAKEISLAHSFGIDVIVADHHTIPKTPPKDAYAILHPKYHKSLYPFKDLTGAGIALKLAYALLSDEKDETKIDKYAEEFLDLATLGTVADLGSLIDENRLIVKYGMEKLKNTKWQGIKYLKHYSGIRPGDTIDTYLIGYRLAPRINAAGRISNPYYSLKLLLQDEGSKHADTLARTLEKFNSTRQTITEKALIEAEEIFSRRPLEKILIASSPKWHSGIIGLIAGKLLDKYNLPAVIMNEKADMLVGSARSPKYFNMIEAITNAGKYLEHFGGHSSAAGFTLKKENLEKFSNSLKKYADKNINKEKIKSEIEIDTVIEPIEINNDLMNLISQFEPFGIGNPEPAFLMKNVEIENIITVGKKKDHLKFKAKTGKDLIEGIGFHMGEFSNRIKNKKLDIVFNLQRNTFNNKTSLQMNVIDLALLK